MSMWRNAIEHTWQTRPMSEIQKLIDRQPKIMQAIIDCDGERTSFWEIEIMYLNMLNFSYFNPNIAAYGNRGIQGNIKAHFPKSIDQPLKKTHFKN